MVQILSLKTTPINKKNHTFRLIVAFIIAMALTAIISVLLTDVIANKAGLALTMVIINIFLVIVTFLPLIRLHSSVIWPYLCSFFCVAGFIFSLLGGIGNYYALLIGCIAFMPIWYMLFDMTDWSHKPGKIIYLFAQLLAAGASALIWYNL